MTNICRPEPVIIARRIIEHLSRNGTGADSFEGILRSVLHDEAVSSQRSLMQEAVSDLVTQGILERIEQGEERRMYRLKKR